MIVPPAPPAPPAPGAVLVSSCGDCPFVMEPDEPIDDWLCSAVASCQDVRAIGPRPPAAPPSWCPLRASDQLVALHLTSKTKI